jgi:hypothetical protein
MRAYTVGTRRGNHAGEKTKQVERPTFTCPSSEARQPSPWPCHEPEGTGLDGCENEWACTRTFLARFLRSLRSLRVGFSTLVARPDYMVCPPQFPPTTPTPNCTHPDKPVPRLEFLLRLLVVVDQAEARATSATKLGAEAEDDDARLVALVLRRELVGEVRFRDVRAAGVEDLEYELLAGEQAVRDELARAQGDRGVRLSGREVWSAHDCLINHPDKAESIHRARTIIASVHRTITEQTAFQNDNTALQTMF